MARLIYSMITSLDGYVADDSGAFEWAAPDEEVHAFVNDLERPIGTYLYGRRMYETMQYWEGEGAEPESPVSADFRQLWQAADKIVYSSSLKAVTTNRTRLERKFDPDEIGELKRTSDRDIGVGGPTLAAHAVRAGLVDEYQMFVNPIVVGGGNQAIPGGIRIALELADERRFRGGVVYLRYVQPG